MLFRRSAYFPLVVTLFVLGAGARAAAVKIGGKEFLPARQAKGESYDAILDFAPAAKPPKEFSVIFAQGPNGHYEVTFGPKRVELAKVVKGARTVLGSGPTTFAPGALRHLTLRRLEDLVVVIANGTVGCRAIDSTFSDGWVLVQAGAGVPQVQKAVIRRREAVFFSDDFMVSPKEVQDKVDRGWRELLGSWACKSIRPENVAKNKAYSTRSANPFAYLGKPASSKTYALSVTGENWWSGYSYHASVKCLDDGAAGLVFGCEGEGTFWLVRLECRSRFARPSRIRLVRMEGGTPKVIAEKFVRTRHGHWYSIGTEVYHGRVRVSFLGWPVMDVSDPRITGGPIGLYAEGPSGANFDDVEVRELARFRFDRGEELARFGRQVSGSWRARTSRGGTPVEIVPDGNDAVVLFGNPSWPGGAVTAEVRLGRRGSCGVVAAADGGTSYRLALMPEGKGALLAKGRGAEKTLAQFKYDPNGGEWCKVGLNLSEPGLVSAYAGGGLVARVKVESRPRGRVGLFARNAPGAAFRGLVANRSPRLLAEHQIGNAIFLDDVYMSSWATERGQWIPDDGPDLARSMSGYTFDGKNIFWRKGDYYGDYVISLPLTIMTQPAAGPDGTKPPPVHTPITGSLSVHFGLKSGDLHSGYAVLAKATGPGVYNVELAHREKVVARAAGVRAVEHNYAVRIYNSGKYIWARIGERELFSYEKPQPGAGTRIAAVRQGEVDFDRLAVYAENLDDSSFERTPTGWRIIGDWQITKRFTCDPRWSWMGVDSLDGYSAMWHRREFPGDLTVELYASMKMRGPSGPYYVPSDINLTMCADQESPGRGYTFLVGGWKNSKTAILRNGKIVAETKEPYLPDTRDGYPSSTMLHRRWFCVKARRKGPKLELFLDNKRYLTYTDPKPLRGGKVAVWTQEQSIMVARMQVYYAKSALPRQVVVPGPEDLTNPPALTPPLRVVCSKRVGYFYDFESGTQKWSENTRGAGNAVPIWDRKTVGSRGGRASLKLFNAECPGRFVAKLPIIQVNLLACPVLSFDYRIPPEVKVNLYFDVGRVGQINKRTYFIALTGPEDSTEGIKRAGRFPNVKADGRWRTARIDIARVMRRLYPTAPALQASNLRFACERRGSYAASGIGGNPQGAAYHIDNFLLVAAGAGKATLRWKPSTAGHKGYAVCTTDRADSDPGSRPNLSAPLVSHDGARPGLRYLHVRPILAARGQKAPVTRFPLYDVGPEVEVAGISPPDRAKWGGEPVKIHLRKHQIAALDTSLLVATIGTTDVRLDSKALSMDWDNALLTLDPSQLPVSFEDGAVVNCSLALRAFGQDETRTVNWQYVASRSRDRTPPSAVIVDGLYELDDFETERDNWRSSGYTVCGIDATTASTGQKSLRIFNTYDGGNFLVCRSFSSRPADRRLVGACPIIEFDYKVGPNVRTDLAIQSSAGLSSFKFVDRSAKDRIGEIPGITADGKWHTASLDIFNPFWTQKRLALASRLDWIGFGDHGWPSAREGDGYSIDNFRVIPVASCRDGLELKCSANDPLGVAGYACRWSARPEDEAPKKIMAAGDTLRVDKLSEGRQYLHVRAVDRAGNWGPTSHYAFIIDSTPPKVTRISPRPGTRIAPYRFAVTITDAYGPDPAALRLTVDRKAFTFRSASLSNARRPSITWDLTRTPEDITTIPNGKVLEFSLTGVRDFAGNTVDPISGSWTMDYRRDRVPPQRVELDLLSAPVAFMKRFDRGTDGVRGYSYGRVERALSSEASSHVLQFTAQHASTQAAILRQPFDLAKTGVLKFDVNLLKSATYMDLLIVGTRFRCKLRMGDPPPNAPKPGTQDSDGYRVLGDMNGIRGKTGWHTQWVDLYPLVKKAFPGLRSYTVGQIWFGRICAPYSRGRMFLDNIAVYGYGKNQMKAKLRSRDITGLSGYAVEVDPDPARVPAKKVNHTAAEFTRTLGRGVWYVKALARDNNGNWSRLPGMIPYVVVTDPPKAKPKGK